MANTSVKNAPFGRWTAQKRAAFYLGRWASYSGLTIVMRRVTIAHD